MSVAQWQKRFRGSRSILVNHCNAFVIGMALRVSILQGCRLQMRSPANYLAFPTNFPGNRIDLPFVLMVPIGYNGSPQIRIPKHLLNLNTTTLIRIQ